MTIVFALLLFFSSFCSHGIQNLKLFRLVSLVRRALASKLRGPGFKSWLGTIILFIKFDEYGMVKESKERSLVYPHNRI